jgi:hypothetical protein
MHGGFKLSIRGRPRPSREIPSGREQCPRLQLRGSAGFAPASLSSPSGEDARSEGIGKELNVGMTVMGGERDVNVDREMVVSTNLHHRGHRGTQGKSLMPRDDDMTNAGIC